MDVNDVISYLFKVSFKQESIAEKIILEEAINVLIKQGKKDGELKMGQSLSMGATPPLA